MELLHFCLSKICYAKLARLFWVLFALFFAFVIEIGIVLSLMIVGQLGLGEASGLLCSLQLRAWSVVRSDRVSQFFLHSAVHSCTLKGKSLSSTQSEGFMFHFMPAPMKYHSEKPSWLVLAGYPEAEQGWLPQPFLTTGAQDHFSAPLLPSL